MRLTGPIPIASSYTVEYILRDDMKEPFRRISVAADCGADAEKKVYESHSPGAIVVTRVTRNMSCARREGD